MEGNIFGSNENCTDPEKLFEHVVAQPSDLLYGLRYHYAQQSNKTKVYPNLDSRGILTKTDHKEYGRCFTATPTKEMIGHGIKQVDIYVKADSTTRGPKILFHYPGMFVPETMGNPLFITTHPRMQKEFQSEYEIHNRLAEAEEPCDDDINYDFDACAQKEIEEKMLSKYGCTTPFGPNKMKICTNQTVGIEAQKEYTNFWNNLFQTDCKKPCRLMYTRLANTKEGIYLTSKPKGKITLFLKDTVRTTNEIFLYSVLSLIAEVGGYVGLFLGVSVNQISTLADKAF